MNRLRLSWAACIHDPLFPPFKPTEFESFVRGGRHFNQRTLCCVDSSLFCITCCPEGGLCTNLWSSRLHFILYSCGGIHYQNKWKALSPPIRCPWLRSRRSLLLQLTAFHNSDGEDGSAISCPWSLTHERQVHNLKENWKRAFSGNKELTIPGNEFKTNPWFARVVSQLRVDPCLDNFDELEIVESLLSGLKSKIRMTSLGIAILMGDLKMIQKILERRFVQDYILLQSFG